MNTTCCQMPKLGNRCSGCGHRQTVGGVAPVSSRRLSMKNPAYPAIELYGRHKAKAHGRELLSSGQFSKVST